MTRLTIALAAAAAAAGAAAIPAPAAAQSNSEVVVYGSDPCPRQTDSSIVVCVHRPEQERYRLPKDQQLVGTRQERESWANKARALNSAGNFGTGSCTSVGPAGYTGCLMQQIHDNRAASDEARSQDTAPAQ